jgi:hypothetical protein
MFFFCLGEQHMQATITWFVVVLGCALPCDDYRLAMANNTGAHGIKRTRRALPCECDEPMTSDCGAAKIQDRSGSGIKRRESLLCFDSWAKGKS